MQQIYIPVPESFKNIHISDRNKKKKCYIYLLKAEPKSVPLPLATYIWFELEHQLISGQEVFLGEQLHVLADVLDVLYRVNLTKRKLFLRTEVKLRPKHEYSAPHLLLILKLIRLNFLDLFVYSERKKETETED